MITTKDTARRREVGSSKNLPRSLSAKSEPHLTGKSGHHWSQLLLQLLGEASEQLSGICRFMVVCTDTACHDVRDSASVGCAQWCDDSSKSPCRQSERYNLSVVIQTCTWSHTCWHILHGMCIPVSEPQFGYGTLTDTEEYRNMLKFRSTHRIWVQKCTIWLTVK